MFSCLTITCFCSSFYHSNDHYMWHVILEINKHCLCLRVNQLIYFDCTFMPSDGLLFSNNVDSFVPCTTRRSAADATNTWILSWYLFLFTFTSFSPFPLYLDAPPPADGKPIKRKPNLARRNMLLRKNLTPKNSVMCLNELKPGLKFVSERVATVGNFTVSVEVRVNRVICMQFILCDADDIILSSIRSLNRITSSQKF